LAQFAAVDEAGKTYGLYPAMSPPDLSTPTSPSFPLLTWQETSTKEVAVDNNEHFDGTLPQESHDQATQLDFKSHKLAHAIADEAVELAM